MKRWIGVAAAALAGAALALAGGTADPLRPFALVGEGLRRLSLSGAAGDALAWALWALLSLSPLLGLLPRGRKRGPADVFFALAALSAFPMWYGLANPSFLTAGIPEGAWALPVAQSMRVALTAILLGGAVVLRLAEDGPGGARAFLKRAGALLVLLMCLEAAAGAFTAAGVLSVAVAEGGALPLVAVQSLCALAVCASALATLSAAVDCTAAMRGGWFSAEAEALRLARRARVQLAVTVAASALLALAGVVALGRVSVAVQWSPPLAELLAALACALLARFVAEGARIKREMDEFV